MMGKKCPKHVEHIISAINHSVASSWFFLYAPLYSSELKNTWVTPAKRPTALRRGV